MDMKMVTLAVVGILVGCGFVFATDANSGVKSISMMLEEAQYQEETVGDVNAAISIYEKIMANEEARRPEAAKALYRYGICLVKKGDKEKAAEIFKDVTNKYEDQKIFAMKAGRELEKLSSTVSNADLSLGDNIYANLAPDVIEYIGNTYGMISMQAESKGLYSNSHIYVVTSEMKLLKGGMAYYQNESNAPLTNKVRLTGTTKPGQTLFDIAGRKMNTEIINDPVRPGFYQIYWTPSEPVSPGQFFYYGWSLNESKKLKQEEQGFSKITMQNTFGSKCVETFFLVLPKSIKIAESSEESTKKIDIGDMSIYAWTKEVPAGEKHLVNVTFEYKKVRQEEPGLKQEMNCDIDPNGTMYFKSPVQGTNTSSKPLETFSFKNSDFVHITKMVRDGKEIPFEEVHDGNHYFYNVKLNPPVMPGESGSGYMEGYITGLINPVAGLKDVYKYYMRHNPGSDEPVLRTETFLLPERARVISKAPGMIQESEENGREKLSVKKIIPMGGSMVVSFEYELGSAQKQ